MKQSYGTAPPRIRKSHLPILMKALEKYESSLRFILAQDCEDVRLSVYRKTKLDLEDVQEVKSRLDQIADHFKRLEKIREER